MMMIQRPAPVWECTESEAYSDPIINMQVVRPKPPKMVDVRRPQRSERMRAGMVAVKMRIAETPDARKEDWEDARPACWKRRGAYCSFY